MGVETLIAIAAISSTIAAVAGTTTGIVGAVQSGKEAKKAASSQADAQKRLEEQMYGRMQNQESEGAAVEARDQAKARQQALAVGAVGRPNTILTGPLGATGEAPGAKKTLLGQ